MNFSEALTELRAKTKKRKFDQTLDLIINLKDFDIKRESLNTFIILPHLNIKKKVCAFLEKPSQKVFTITKNDIEKITKTDIKKLAKEYDFFIANAKLMPLIASKFGKILGSAGKMPDPKLGCVIMHEDEKTISETVERLSKMVKIKAKEASIKLAIGKESMSDEELEKNASLALKTVINALTKKELNIKSVMLKFTMSAPIKVKS
ncbi:MAG: hypothetical protein N3G19_01030 [Candidatus Pacearchaeota archaeon]|nr:hypothetical protein [Candidatus Pacearchaeota archaeon]